jgi:hypothetical protein
VRHGNYDAVIATDVDLLKNPVVAAAVGTAAMAVDVAGAAYRVAERLPVLGPLIHRGVTSLSDRGDRWVAESADQFKALVATVAVQLVDLILDELDLNALVRERRLPVGLLRAIGCVVFPIGLLWAVIDRRRRSLQDIVFRTRVIYSRPPAG